jgi:hypothetical protein
MKTSSKRKRKRKRTDMYSLLVAAGIGVTAWCIATHQPTWIIAMNVIMDVVGVFVVLKSK